MSHKLRGKKDEKAASPTKSGIDNKDIDRRDAKGSERRSSKEEMAPSSLTVVGKTAREAAEEQQQQLQVRRGELPARARARKRAPSGGEPEVTLKNDDVGGPARGVMTFDFGVTGSTLESRKALTKPSSVSSGRSSIAEKVDNSAAGSINSNAYNGTGESTFGTDFKLNLDFGITGSTVELGSARRNTPRKSCSKLPVPNLEYGFIPSALYTRLNDGTAWKVRSTAIEELQEVLDGCNDMNQIIPHMQPFLQFLSSLIMDR